VKEEEREGKGCEVIHRDW